MASLNPKQPRTNQNTRKEKLEAIATMFGAKIAERLQQPKGAASALSQVGIDKDRLAWQRNHLIQHLRRQSQETDQRATDEKKVDNALPVRPSIPAFKPKPSALKNLKALSGMGDLSDEHPAVIAQLLHSAPQSRRVEVLRALPGRTARSVMTRLRNA